MDTAARVKAFLVPHLGGEDIGDDVDIFASGYVNSLFAMQLVAFVEQEFDFVVGSEDLEFENFRTVVGIVRLVDAKTGGSR